MTDINPASVHSTNNNLGSFLSSLALNGSLFVLQIATFVLLKSKLHMYKARTIPQSSPQVEAGPWKWLIQTWKASKQEIILKNGLDAYMSIRFLKMITVMFGCITLVTFPTLIPIDVVGMAIIQIDPLASLGFANINRYHQSRYWAQTAVAFLLTAFVLYYIHREFYLFIFLRQDFLLSHQQRALRSYHAHARTVLITAIPLEHANEHDIRAMFSFVPHGIQKVWLYKNQKRLIEAYELRKTLSMRLETIITRYLRAVAKHEKCNAISVEMGPYSHGGMLMKSGSEALSSKDTSHEAPTHGHNPQCLGIRRPKYRIQDKSTTLFGLLTYFPWIWGKRVDAIEYLMGRIQQCNMDIHDFRKDLRESKAYGTCVVLCNTRLGAQILAQCVNSRDPLYMSQCWVGLSPSDIVWENIDDGPYWLHLRYLVSWMATLLLLFLWAVPVAVVGITSNISTACRDYPWLPWICNTSPLTRSIIQGFFPPILLEILFLTLPRFLKALAKFEGPPRRSLISLAVYSRYFMFMIVYGFLVISLFAGLGQVLRDLGDPIKTVQNFTVYLPNASTFFLTYMLQQGLMGSAGTLLQVAPSISLYAKKIIFTPTPRRITRARKLALKFDLGTTLPKMSLLATIGLTFSVVSQVSITTLDLRSAIHFRLYRPITNLVSCVTFALFWFSWKFLFIWVLDQPSGQETGGLYFPLLMSNLFTGLYIQHVCLGGLFFFAVDENGNHTSTPQGVMMVLLAIITVIAHVAMTRFFSPVIFNLPLSNLQPIEHHNLTTSEAEDSGQMLREHRRQAWTLLTSMIFLRKRNSKTLTKGVNMEESGPNPMSIPVQSAGDGQKQRLAEEASRLHAESFVSHYSGANNAAKKAQGLISRMKSSSISVPSPRTQVWTRSCERRAASQPEPASTLMEDIVTGGTPSMSKSRLLLPVDDIQEPDWNLHAFDHPSTYVPQQPIWIPRLSIKDTGGISDSLIKELSGNGLATSDDGATLDEYGRIRITGDPPGSMPPWLVS